MPPLQELRKVKKNALVIIAHPDDESIFMGGTIAEFKKWHWRILCVTDCDERYNRVRRKEFLSACRIYKKNGSKVEPFMLSIVKKNGCFSRPEIAGGIADHLCKYGRPDIVFTHNKAGEYGHKTHKLIHNAVKEIGFRNIYTFSYGMTAARSHRRVEPVILSRRSFSVKKQAVSSYMRGSQRSNLLRLKRMVNTVLNLRCEAFGKYS